MRISHQFVRIIARTDIFTCIFVEVALLTLSFLIWTCRAIKINIWSNTGNRWWLIMVIMAERSLYFYILSITTSPDRLSRALRQKYRTKNWCWWWVVSGDCNVPCDARLSQWHTTTAHCPASQPNKNITDKDKFLSSWAEKHQHARY